jgi:hypothetical protein
MGMGRLMTMFDELLDPDPPKPGERELTAVSARARTLRRKRRASWTVPLLCIAALAGGVALRDDRPAARTIVQPTDEVDAVRRGTVYRLTDAAAIGGLAPFDFAGTSVPYFAGASGGSLERRADGAVCVRDADAGLLEPCTPAGNGIVAVTAPYTDGSGESLLVLVDGSVDIVAVTPGVPCERVLGDGIDGWRCVPVDPAAVSITVVDDSHVIVESGG